MPAFPAQILIFFIKNMNAHFCREVFLLLAAILIASSLHAQKVFPVEYESQADLKVFVVQYESQADLKVFKVKYESQANKPGLWFRTQYESQAGYKIFFVKYESQADLKIYFVDYESQAGWRNKQKSSLFF